MQKVTLPNPSLLWGNWQEIPLFFLDDIPPGVGQSGKSKWCDFSWQYCFWTADPFPGTNFSRLWRIFFDGKQKEPVEELWIISEKEHGKDVVSILPDLRINLSWTGKAYVWIHTWQCPRWHQQKKRGKYSYPRPLSYQNTKKFIIFTFTNPRIVSAEKEVVATFTLQLFLTILS